MSPVQATRAKEIYPFKRPIQALYIMWRQYIMVSWMFSINASRNFMNALKIDRKIMPDWLGFSLYKDELMTFTNHSSEWFDPGSMRLCFFILASVQLCYAITYLEEQSQSSRVLSRKRRFSIPSQTGWSLGASFSVSFPLEGLDTSFTGSVPFSYKFNVTG